MKSTPRLIQAIDTQDLLDKVARCKETNEDLHMPLFVSREGRLCQFVVPANCIYEYELIVAGSLESLEQQASNLTLLGYDFIFNTVMWNGYYLQWMHRLNHAGITVRDAVVKLNAERAADVFIAASREDELALVEDVRAALDMEPTVRDGRYVVSIPFPLRLS